MSVLKALKSILKRRRRNETSVESKLSIVQDEGGTYILAYEFIVSLGIISCIVFLTCRAQELGLSKRNAFLIALLLWVDLILFPWAFWAGWLIYWILSIIILAFSGTIWLVVRKGKRKEKGKGKGKGLIF